MQVALILLLISLTGCSAKVVLHPIQQTDFYVREEPEHEGDVCMSEFYFKEVLKAKIEAQ